MNLYATIMPFFSLPSFKITKHILNLYNTNYSTLINNTSLLQYIIYLVKSWKYLNNYKKSEKYNILIVRGHMNTFMWLNIFKNLRTYSITNIYYLTMDTIKLSKHDIFTLLEKIVVKNVIKETLIVLADIDDIVCNVMPYWDSYEVLEKIHEFAYYCPKNIKIIFHEGSVHLHSNYNFHILNLKNTFDNKKFMLKMYKEILKQNFFVKVFYNSTDNCTTLHKFNLKNYCLDNDQDLLKDLKSIYNIKLLYDHIGSRLSFLIEKYFFYIYHLYRYYPSNLFHIFGRVYVTRPSVSGYLYSIEDSEEFEQLRTREHINLTWSYLL